MRSSNPAGAETGCTGSMASPESRTMVGAVQLTPVKVSERTLPGFGTPFVIAELKFSVGLVGVVNWHTLATEPETGMVAAPSKVKIEPVLSKTCASRLASP